MHDTGDSGGIVRAVRLKLSASQGLLKGKALSHLVVDGIGLVAVCHNGIPAKHSDGSVDDQAGIFQLGRVKRLRADPLSLGDKDTVAAVGASSHDEVSRNCFFAVCRTTDHNAASGILIALKFFTQL